MKYLIALTLMLLTVAVGAQTPATMNTGLSWSGPTQYTDGTALPAADLDKYTIKCGTAAGAYTLSMDTAGTVTSRTKAQLITGMGLNLAQTYFCVLTVTTKNGLTSANSATVAFLIPDQRAPKAPTPVVQ